MSGTHPPDPAATLRSCEALILRAGLDRDEYLGICALSYASGLPEAKVEALCTGQPVPLEALGAQVTERIHIAQQTRLHQAADGTTRHYTSNQIADAAGMSRQGLVKAMQSARGIRDLEYVDGVARLFDVRIDFFTDPPAEALDRVLQQIHKRLLELTVERQDEKLHQLEEASRLQDLRERYGLLDMAARGAPKTMELLGLFESVLEEAAEQRRQENRP
ncbi:hypothetical protein [Streptomyces sp. NPDC059564]|uniref:hypothetical protein n=1 Tax=Streptomyces sp. NPDC059564 TaxID=3346865 RepID=UPI00369EF0E1